MDLISRQQAIDAIEFGITYARAINKETGEVKELFQEGNNELRKAVERINKLPSTQSEPHWIPVTERLPESAEDDLEYPTVLVCFDNGDVDTACFYESTREWGCGDMYDCICHPIAWMPLPEPMRMEKQ